jgi:hypothetical protein
MRPATRACLLCTCRTTNHLCPPLCVTRLIACCCARRSSNHTPTSFVCRITRYCCVRHSRALSRSHPPPLCHTLLMCAPLTSSHASCSCQPPLCAPVARVAHLVARPPAHTSLLYALLLRTIHLAARPISCTPSSVCHVVCLATLACLLYVSSPRYTPSRSCPFPLCVPRCGLPLALPRD